MSASIVTSGISAYPHKSTGASAPLDICAKCTDNDGLPSPCPLLRHCADARRLTLEIAEQKITARCLPGAAPSYRMGLAMAINDVLDMAGARTLDGMLARMVRHE